MKAVKRMSILEGAELSPMMELQPVSEANLAVWFKSSTRAFRLQTLLRVHSRSLDISSAFKQLGSKQKVGMVGCWRLHHDAHALALRSRLVWRGMTSVKC